VSTRELVVARWDLDKTYLRTEFDTPKQLFRTATERPDKKRSVPGAAAVLRELHQRGTRIHIVSGSPRQLRRRLEEKLALDGVRYEELSLKPNLGNLLRLRFRALRDQLGYKLPLLLEARVRDQRRAALLREILIGDDSEADALVYCVYRDLLSGKLGALELEDILEAGRAFRSDQQRALRALERLRVGEPRARVLIHLDRQTPPSRFEAFAAVVPFFNYQQVAFVLLEDDLLDARATLRIAADMMLYHHFDADSLARSYADLARRGHSRSTAPALLQAGWDDFVATCRSGTPTAELEAMLTALRQLPALEPATREPASEPQGYAELARAQLLIRQRSQRWSLGRGL
jgi:hypothetical protein